MIYCDLFPQCVQLVGICTRCSCSEVSEISTTFEQLMSIKPSIPDFNLHLRSDENLVKYLEKLSIYLKSS